MVRVAYDGGFMVSSNFARKYAVEVAAAASMGLITTLQVPGMHGRFWRATPKGIHLIHEE